MICFSNLKCGDKSVTVETGDVSWWDLVMMMVILWWKLSSEESYLLMKVIIVKVVMTCDVLPVAMFDKSVRSWERKSTLHFFKPYFRLDFGRKKIVKNLVKISWKYSRYFISYKCRLIEFVIRNCYSVIDFPTCRTWLFMSLLL